MNSTGNATHSELPGDDGLRRRTPALALADRGGAPDPSPWENFALIALFTLTIFASSTLVFLVQPMVAKMILPLFGGAPSVWNTAMVFFQVILLAGYAYAHLSTRLFGVRRQPLVHLAVLALPLLALPVALPADADPTQGSLAPALWVLYALVASAGLPYFVVTTASPLLQRWFTQLDHPAAKDPYFLYAAGNAGSLLGLLAYPVVVESSFSLAGQARLWAAGYGVFMLLTVACIAVVMLRGRRETTAVTAGAEAAPESAGVPGAGAGANYDSAALQTIAGRRVRTARHLAFAAIPSSLMLGVTTYITTDIASAPLFWVLPLAIYLLSFIVAFSPRWTMNAATAGTLFATVCVPLTLAYVRVIAVPTWGLVGLHLAGLLFASILAHKRLADERPPVEQLTAFYLTLSLGGVLGGSLTALAAPMLFNDVWEYPLAIAFALLMRPARAGQQAQTESPPVSNLRAIARRYRWAAELTLPLLALLGLVAGAVVIDGSTRTALMLAPATILAALVRRPGHSTLGLIFVLSFGLFGGFDSWLKSERTFFGVLRVTETAGPTGTQRQLLHGTTLHGRQNLEPGTTLKPLSYFTQTGPAGDLFRGLQADRPFDKVGIVGLGVGTLASYGQPGQDFTFYEIDSAVVDIAEDDRYFTFMSSSKANVRSVTGDGRLELEKAAPGTYDLLVLDAFSSDAVPTHLLTREALELYASRIPKDGAIAVHISSRHLRLEPVVARVAEAAGLDALIRVDVPWKAAAAAGAEGSIWVVLAHSKQELAPIAGLNGWRPLHAPEGTPLWTDDFSNVLAVVNWRH